MWNLKFHSRVLKKNIAAYLRSHKIVIEYMGSS